MAFRLFSTRIKPSRSIIQFGTATFFLGAAISMGPSRLFTAKAATSSLRLITQTASIPHPEKAAKGGEDAHFVSKSGYAVGVADGVGGWASQGVDPAVYSRSLMKFANEAADEMLMNLKDSTSFLDVKGIVDYAWKKNMGIPGSSTAVVAILNKNTNVLSTANLGDSGFMVVRKGKMIYRSMEQTKGFNFPFQLAGDVRFSDKASDSFVKHINVEKGDFVVLGSDGLFDNMFDQEILSALEEGIAKGLKIEPPKRPEDMTGPSQRPRLEDFESNPNLFSKDTTMREENFDKIINLLNSDSGNNLAMALAKQASIYGKSKTKDTPFAKSAKEHRFQYKGGKEDDITVVVSLVSEAPPQSKL